MRNILLEALFPSTRRHLLGILFLSNRRWYALEIAQHLHVPSSSLQRELAALHDAGLLIREVDGKRVYYRANLDCRIYNEVRAILVKTAGFTEPIAEALLPLKSSIHIACVFGSAADGDLTAGYFDLLVVGSIGFTDLAVPLSEAENALSAAINVTRFDQTEFQLRLKQHDSLVQSIVAGPKVFLIGTEEELVADRT